MHAQAARTLPTIVQARAAISATFFVLGAGFGLWAVHIPLVQRRLAIPPDTLGLALLVLAIGAIMAMPLCGWAVSHVGSRRLTVWLACLFAVLMPLPTVADSTAWLFGALWLFGLGMGGLDVAMNTQAAAIETARGRPTMSSIHAFYSLGGLAGAAAGGGMIARGWGDGRGAMVSAAVLLGMALSAARYLWNTERQVAAGPHFVMPPRAALGVGLLAFLAFSAEGAIGDWSALFLLDHKQSTPAIAATGFAAFSICMATVRLVGDPIVLRMGAVRTMTAGGGLMAAGIALALLAPWPLLSAAGFGVVGIGAANIVPVLFTASARIPGVSPSAGIAATVTMGYAGFVLMPPILGFVAGAWGLPASLGIVALMAVAIAAAARTAADIAALPK